MSLLKQLWIAILLVMTLAFGGSLVVSVLSARHYLEQQLQVKNMDNATALALSLSQLSKDPVMVELLVSAQFDVGHYRFIRITSPTGKTLVERVFTGEVQDVPHWFIQLISFSTTPGQALIQDGWKQYGTLTLASQEQYAYKSLWHGSLELLLWFVLGSLATGGVGSLLIRFITRPLGDVVSQANAIAERRFSTIQEPRTPELRSVARAMNEMVGRLKAMFSEEAARLEALRRKVNHDALTGLASREYFLSHLQETLEGDQFAATGSLIMVRLLDLNELNSRLGRHQADALLKDVATELDDHETAGYYAGRIKAAEFAVVCPGLDTPQDVVMKIHSRLFQNVLPKWRDKVPDLFHLSAVHYHRIQNIGQLLARADEALAHAANKAPNSWQILDGDNARTAVPAEQWRALLTEAVNGRRLSLHFFPVMSCDSSSTLHHEGVIRLQVDGQDSLLSAGDFMPMAAQLHLTAKIDLRAIKLALEHLHASAGDIAINLAAETISDFQFLNELKQLLRTHPEACQRLLFEVPEYGVLRQFDAFCELTRNLKQLGCRIGIEYFRNIFAESTQLTDLGLDYIKVHPSYIRDIANNPGNQEFLKGLCSMARNFGIVVIALGVESDSDHPLLASLGFDGMTGPGVK